MVLPGEVTRARNTPGGSLLSSAMRHQTLLCRVSRRAVSGASLRSRAAASSASMTREQGCRAAGKCGDRIHQRSVIDPLASLTERISDSARSRCWLKLRPRRVQHSGARLDDCWRVRHGAQLRHVAAQPCLEAVAANSRGDRDDQRPALLHRCSESFGHPAEDLGLTASTRVSARGSLAVVLAVSGYRWPCSAHCTFWPTGRWRSVVLAEHRRQAVRRSMPRPCCRHR